MLVFLSKLVWFVLAPFTLLLGLTAAGLILLRWDKTRRWGRRIAIGAAGALFALAVLPIGPWTLRALEHRFPPYEPCASDKLAGILLLGGGLQSMTIDGRIIENLNDGADRIRYAAQLAREHPELPVLVSGGQVFARPGARSEAEGMADLLVELGVPRGRITLENASRTTAENAAMTAQSASATPGRWLLVTSAYHMPRAMGLFRKAGVDVVPAPTDWRVDDGQPLLLASPLNNVGQFEMAARELVGLVAFRLMGQTNALIPSPKSGACPAPRESSPAP